MYQWSRPIVPIVLLFLFIVGLLIPGVRRVVFMRLLKNRFIRNFGLRAVLGMPFLRQQLMTRIFSGKEASPNPTNRQQPYPDLV